MKKLLFCASILALAVSCTEDEFDSVAMKGEQYKGISFESSLMETPQTKGSLEYDAVTGKHNFFWYAEKDRIGIWSVNTKATGINTGSSVTAWTDAKAATYKATQSAPRGVFTGVNDDNILDFIYTPEQYEAMTAEKLATNSAKFFALYPFGESYPTTASTTDGNQFIIENLPTLADQTQRTDDGADVTQKLLMYSYTTAYPKNDYDAVGEKIDLKFTRPFTALVFSTTGINEEYQNYFGNLQQVKVTAEGYDKEGTTIPASIIDYGTGVKYLVDLADNTKSGLLDGTNSTVEDFDWDATTATDEASTITLSVGGGTAGNGLAWSDAKRAYMAINTVDRSAFVEKGVKENVKYEYTFKYIDFVEDHATNTSWPPEEFKNQNIFMTAPKLDITTYDYLVTKTRDAANTRVLIVNKGTFSKVFNEDKTKVMWNGTEIDPSEFNVIVVNEGVKLTDTELGLLKKFTNLDEITLAENDKIPAGTFNQNLTKINFPKVTVIDKTGLGVDANGNGVADNVKDLATVLLPSYKFEDADIARSFLNPNKLQTLDMSAVPAMNVGFPSTGFTLDGFKFLKTIYVQDGIDLGANAFYGCEQLVNVVKKGADGTDVPAVVNLAGTSVFNGCKALVSVNIENTDIPANSFKGCEQLVNVKVNNAQVKPTSVGISAFEGCKALVNMDLSNVKEIVKDAEEKQIASVGANAFKDCVKLIGVTRTTDDKIIIQVGGQIIGDGAFSGCTDLVHIEFLHATQIGDGAVDITSGDLKQIQLDKIVTFIGKNTANPFGSDMSSVDLFITPGQGGVDGNVLKWGSGANNEVEFKSIRDKATE